MDRRTAKTGTEPLDGCGGPRPAARRRDPESWIQVVRAGCSWLNRRWKTGAARRLRLDETLPLGEKRFVAVIEFEQQRFLVGGAANCVVLLAWLPAASPGDGEQADGSGRQRKSAEESAATGKQNLKSGGRLQCA